MTTSNASCKHVIIKQPILYSLFLFESNQYYVLLENSNPEMMVCLME